MKKPKYKLTWIDLPFWSLKRFSGWAGYIEIINAELEELEEFANWLAKGKRDRWQFTDSFGSYEDFEYLMTDGIDDSRIVNGFRLYMASKDDATIFMWANE